MDTLLAAYPSAKIHLFLNNVMIEDKVIRQKRHTDHLFLNLYLLKRT